MKVDNQHIIDRVYKYTETLLITKGLKSWNMDDLAKKAGVAKNTLYKIIGSKEKLIETILIRKYTNNINKVNHILNSCNSKECKIEILQRALDTLAEVIAGYEKQIAYEVFSEYPKIEQRAHAFQKEIAANLTAHIEECQTRNVINCNAESSDIFDIFQGIIEWNIQKDLSDEEFIRKVKHDMRVVIRGLTT